MRKPHDDHPEDAAALPGLGRVMPVVTCVIFVVEAIIMVAFALLPKLSDVVETIVDATSLSLISAPLIYFLIVRPLREQLRTHMARNREYQTQLIEARDAAETAARAKADFLATMSHEIRTPMNGVLGFAHLLQDTELDTQQREWLGTIHSSGEALLSLINDILDFSKIEAGKAELESVAFDLPAAVRGATSIMMPQAAARSISLDVEIDEDVPQVLLGDPNRVRQVLINLIGHAIKFTEQGSVRVRVNLQESAVHVAVRDSGIGIPEDKRSRLFQAFMQVDASTTRRFGGTGLGLAISRRFVELMGGEIGVDSVVGQGSTFWFTLPVPSVAVQLDQAVLPEIRASQPREVDRRRRVLVAEDNPVNAMLVRRLLEKLGCEVHLARNGREAVEQGRAGGHDLVLMDCHMPELDGLEAARELRALGPKDVSHLPIIALTASAMEADRKAAMDSGMDDFLTKPIVPGDLEDCVRRWAA
jgi:signal transduction histidine kinase